METFLESLVSPQTRRSYKRGIKKFLKFYGKDLKSFLKEKYPSKKENFAQDLRATSLD